MSVPISRIYAVALCEAADAKDKAEPYAALLDAVAGAVAADERIAVVLESPRVPKPVKSRILADALAGAAPPEFVRLLQARGRRGRQGPFGPVAHEYQRPPYLPLNPA